MASLFNRVRQIAIAAAVAATTALSLAGDAHAQRRSDLASMDGWTVLGSAIVSDRGERDRIRVRGRDRYSQVKLCVIGHPIELYRWDVVFGNGRVQDIETRRRFRANSCTRAVDLRGRNDRRIERIVLEYESLRDRGRQPIVIVLGR